ncbi:hypothetical protein [Clostridium butyricum]|uniref:hypothetical protein n=1 Tax=Clostridium butyricum TaxID=1492 RepID=UPI00374F00A1
MLSGLNEEYVDLKATITDSDGVLNKLAETMQDNAKGNMIKLGYLELSIILILMLYMHNICYLIITAQFTMNREKCLP